MMTDKETIMTETNDMRGAAARTVDSATSNVHEAIDKARDIAMPGVEQLASGAHQATDRLAGSASQFARTLDTRSGQLMDAQTRLTESCCQHVREKPIKSLGIAVAAGFLLGWLAGRR